MKPEIPQPIDNPEADARILQAENHHEDTSALLGVLIEQNEKNNPEPILETIALETEASKNAIINSGDKIVTSVEGLKPKLSKIDEAQKVLAEVLNKIPLIKGEKGEKGDTGDRGQTGETGDKGKKGDKGDKGERGEKGEQGSNGIDGKDADEDQIIKKVIKEIPKHKEKIIEVKEIIKQIRTLPEEDKLSYDDLKDTPFIPHPSSRDYDFVELKDVPKTYAEQGNKLVKVKSDETGLEFVDDEPRVVQLDDLVTITINADITDVGELLTLSQNSTIANPTGTPYSRQKIQLSITSTTSRTLTWSSQYQGSTDLALPEATSGSSKTDELGFEWNQTASKWRLLAKNFGF